MVAYESSKQEHKGNLSSQRKQEPLAHSLTPLTLPHRGQQIDHPRKTLSLEGKGEDEIVVLPEVVLEKSKLTEKAS